MERRQVNGTRQRQKFLHTILALLGLWCIFCQVIGFACRLETNLEFSKESMTVTHTLSRVY